MKITQSRSVVATSTLKVPVCRLPRSGDAVVWYQNSVRRRGKLIGHTAEGMAWIHPEEGGRDQVVPFDSIRIEDLDRAVGPIWRALPPGGRVLQATAQDRLYLERVLSRTVPPGICNRDLVQEIWERGFEVFLTGPSIRDTVNGEPPLDAEVVTTMPLDRLHSMVTDMYGAANVATGELDRPLGRLQVGTPGTSDDPSTDVRLFRYGDLGKPTAVFGVELLRDVEHGDFTCNSVYYDPINDVFVDPTGRGLDDAETSSICPCFNAAYHSSQDRAVIGMRFIDLRLRDYQIAEGYARQLATLIGLISSFPKPERAAQLRTIVFANTFCRTPAEVWDAVHALFVELDMEDVWNFYVTPCGDLLR